MNFKYISKDISGEDFAKQINRARSRQNHLQATSIFPTTNTEQDFESLSTIMTHHYNTPDHNVDLSARLSTSHTRSHESLDIIATIYHHEDVGNAQPGQHSQDGFNSQAYLRAKQQAISNNIHDTHLRLLNKQDKESHRTRRTLKLYQDSIGKLAMTDRELQNRGYKPWLERDLPDKTSIAYNNRFTNVESTDKAINYIRRLDIMQP